MDDSGQLTIKCSQDYFSLDCGITAFELDDYSPAEEAECQIRGLKSHHCFPSLESDFPELIQSVGLLTVTAEHLSSVIGSPIDPQLRCEDSSASQPTDTIPTSSTMNRNALQGENTLSKRHLQDSFNCNEMSPTQPSLPKKAMYPEGLSQDDMETILKRAPHTSSLQFQADMSRSTPSLLGQPDRSKFWLELTTVYPNSVRHSCDNLRTMNSRNWKPSRQASLQNLQVSGSDPALQRSSSESGEASDLEHPASHKLSLDPQENCLVDTPQNNNSPKKNPPDTDSSPLTICDPTQKIASPAIPEKKRPSTTGRPLKEESWYGSDEYLALPSQLKKTEILALKLETIAKALPQRPTEEQIQDVDDWELSDVHSEWESSTPPQAGCRYGKAFLSGHLSPTSSSDIAPSLDESIESGPLSDLLSEDEVYWHAGECKRTEKPAAVEEHCRHHQDLIKQLLEDIQHQENHKDIWNKIEVL